MKNNRLNTNYFTSKILWSGDKRSRLERVGTTIALVSVALSIMVMLFAITILDGFKHEIREKATGFVGDVILTSPSEDIFLNRDCIKIDSSIISRLRTCNNIKSVSPYILKSGIAVNRDEIQGVVLKGIDNKDLSNPKGLNVEASERFASLLGIELGDEIRTYFIDGNGTSVRLFKMGSFYYSPLKNIDKMLLFADIDEIRKINGWEEWVVSGVEIRLKDQSKLDDTVSEIEGVISSINKSDIAVVKITDVFSDLFDWLALLDLNVLVILVLMIVVAGFNMISGLLILLFEKSYTIGLLKTLGMRNLTIYKIFLVKTMRIAMRGLLIGNILAFVLIFVQMRFKLIPLDPENYFLDSVPIFICWEKVVLINLLSLFGILLSLFMPSKAIAGIAPDRSLRIE